MRLGRNNFENFSLPEIRSNLTYFHNFSAGHSLTKSSSIGADVEFTVKVSCRTNFLCAIGLGRGIFDETPWWFITVPTLNISAWLSLLTPTLLVVIRFVLDAVVRISGIGGGGVLVPICWNFIKSAVWTIWSRFWATSVIDSLCTKRIKSLESVALFVTDGVDCVACWCVIGLNVWVALDRFTGSLFMSFKDNSGADSAASSGATAVDGEIVIPLIVVIIKFGSSVPHDALCVGRTEVSQAIERNLGLKLND